MGNTNKSVTHLKKALTLAEGADSMKYRNVSSNIAADSFSAQLDQAQLLLDSIRSEGRHTKQLHYEIVPSSQASSQYELCQVSKKPHEQVYLNLVNYICFRNSDFDRTLIHLKTF